MHFILWTVIYDAFCFSTDLKLLLHPIFPPGPVITTHYSSESICRTLYRRGWVQAFELEGHVSIGEADQPHTLGLFFKFICLDLKSYLPRFSNLSPPEIDRVGPFLMRCPKSTKMKVLSREIPVRELMPDGEIVQFMTVGPWDQAYCLHWLRQAVQYVRTSIRDCVDLAWEKIQEFLLTPPRMPFEIIAFTDGNGYRSHQNVAVDNLWLIPLNKDLTERPEQTMSLPHSSTLKLERGLDDYGIGYRACSIDIHMDIELNLAMVPLVMTQ